MYSKPSAQELARLSRVNIVEDIVIQPPRDELEEALENLLNNGFPHVAFEANNGAVQVNDGVQNQVNDGAVQVNDVDNPNAFEPNVNNDDIEEELIMNDIEMLDGNQLQEEALLIVERDLSLDEVRVTRGGVEERLEFYLTKVTNCNDLLDVLARRERFINEHYQAMLDQRKLIQIFNRN